jgi:hypothetical protein
MKDDMNFMLVAFAQACQLIHAVGLTPSPQTLPHPPRCDAVQLCWYEKLTSVRLDTRAVVHVSRPFWHQEHGFVQTTSNAELAFAASLIDSAAYRAYVPGRRLVGDYVAEARPMISIYSFRSRIPPLALTACYLVAHLVHTQN